ncbi:hypothetical protein GCM10008171_30100 [Methylopila jiangsuensis]|uniref:Uncharacterized protein n=2 Tax=Methylopila jiangsuensis TaxID=586230 RepID=A0A9W6N500_9HYPH|nr:hypothetical protein GCM10008171_30100 [Methylopila jiangsuensis]
MGRAMTDSVTPSAVLIDRLVSLAEPEPAPADQGLAAVARETGVGERYRVWRGRSGRRYLVTVMPLGEAVRVEEAVVLVVAVDPDGGRRIIWAGESGHGLPALALEAGQRIEAHVHLLAASSARRRAAVDDLESATQSYSSVLTASAAASHASVGSVTPSRSSSRAVLST